MCVQLAVAYFAYLRWAVTVPHGGGYTAPTGPAALPPRGPGPPASVHTLRPGTEGDALPLIAPLVREKRRHRNKRRKGATELNIPLQQDDALMFGVPQFGQKHNNMQHITAQNT